jgi:succinoglycan biosynthesis protein ExoM
MGNRTKFASLLTGGVIKSRRSTGTVNARPSGTFAPKCRGVRERGGRDWDRTSDPHDVNVSPLGVTTYFTANSALISAHERHNPRQFTPCLVQRTRAPNEESVRVAICVCTCNRPRMLERCLRSLSEQLVPAGLQVSVIIIDNDPAGSARNEATAYANAAPFDVRYEREPKRGIATARNAAIDAAIATGADWIAFIDDDEWATPDWIANLMAPDYRDTPVLAGPVLPVYPDIAPFWCLNTPKALKPAEEGKRVKTAISGNVRFSAEIVKAGIRFNERLKLMGGEDQEFFSAAHKAGFAIRKTLRAIAYETAHPERLTYRGQVKRAYWCAASDMRRDAVLRGWPWAISRKAHTVPSNIVFGAFEILASPLFLIGGRLAFKKRAVAGGKKIAKGVGRAAGMFGAMPQPYRVIVGN